MTVTVPTAGDGVVVTATDIGGGSVTATTTDGVAVLNLPDGTWDLTATVTSDDATTTDYATNAYAVISLDADAVTLDEVVVP